MLLKRSKLYFGVKFIRAERINSGFWCCMNSDICELWTESGGHIICSNYRLPGVNFNLYDACMMVNPGKSNYIYLSNVAKEIHNRL